MTTDEKILKTLANIQTNVTTIKDVQQKQGKQIDILVDGLSHTNTAIKTLATKHDVEEIVDAKVDAAKSELKEDILMLDAKVSKVVKKVQSHDRRITNIEDREGIENPDKN